MTPLDLTCMGWTSRLTETQWRCMVNFHQARNRENHQSAAWWLARTIKSGALHPQLQQAKRIRRERRRRAMR